MDLLTDLQRNGTTKLFKAPIKPKIPNVFYFFLQIIIDKICPLRVRERVIAELDMFLFYFRMAGPSFVMKMF